MAERGRPKFVEEQLKVGLTESSRQAMRWLMRRSGLQSKTTQANEALEQYARSLGWKGPKSPKEEA